MKWILLIIFLSGVYRPGFSQTNRFTAGCELGPSIICLKDPGHIYLEDIGIGFSAGGFIQYNTRNFSIKLAPGFERKGNSTNISNLNLNYFILPVLYKVELGSKVKLLFNFGPYLGWLSGAYYAYDAPAEHHDYTDHLHRFDAGVSVGFGISIPIEKKFNVALEMRNNFGLYQIVIPDENTDYNWEYTTCSTNLLISFSYNFGKRVMNDH